MRKNKNEFFGKCHLDPDIRKDIFKSNYDLGRTEEWKPAFGQKDSSLKHLIKQGVEEGDLFKFFGLFKQADLVNGKYQFVLVAKEKHIIWGYLRIDRILKKPTSKDYPWLGIKPYVQRFIDFAKNNPYKRFLVTKIGCGIEGFDYKEITPLFTSVIRNEISNICLPQEWLIYLVSLEGIGKD